MEFSIQMNSEGVWIPITSSQVSTLIGSRENDENVEDVVIRGYHVEPNLASPGSISVQVCDFTHQVNSIQFRWLQTSIINDQNRLTDIWTLEAVNISYHDINSNTLLLDQFDESELK